MAVMHKRLRRHPIGLLGVCGIYWRGWLNGSHLLVANRLVLDRGVGRRIRRLGFWRLGKLCYCTIDIE